MSSLSLLQIGLIASSRQTSGSDRYYFDLVRALRARGDRVRGVVLGDPAAVRADVESFAPEGSRTLRRWRGLRRAVGRAIGDADVVVSHWAAHAFPVLDRLGRRPLVVHFHNPWLHEGRAAGAGVPTLAWRWLQEHSVFARAARFVVLSEANAQVLADTYGVARARIRVIPGGTDLERFRPDGTRDDARARLGWVQQRPTVLVVARLVPAKGVDLALDALPAIRRAVPGVRLAIVGTGPEEGALRERAHALGLDDAVHFAGLAHDQIADVYRAADVTLVPSRRFESFGLVAAESLACGTPVLVTPVDGVPEVVRALDPELVLASTSSDAIAASLVRALDGGRSLPTAAACVAYAQRFGWARVADGIHDVYAEVA